MKIQRFFRFVSPASILLLGLTLACGFTSRAEARPEKAGGEEALAARFQAMDANTDGKVSPQEFTIALPQMRDTAFGAMDENADGFLSLEEWQKAMAGHMGAMPPAGMGGMGAPSSNGTGMTGANNGTSKGPELIMPPAKTPPQATPAKKNP